MTIVSIRDVNIYLQLNLAVTIDWNFNSMWTHACIRVKLFSQWIKSPLFQTKRNVSLERRDTIAVRFVSMLWFLIKWHSSSICVSAIRLMNKVELTIMDESSWLKKRARTRSRASVSLTFLYFSLRHLNTDVFFFFSVRSKIVPLTKFLFWSSRKIYEIFWHAISFVDRLFIDNWLHDVWLCGRTKCQLFHLNSFKCWIIARTDR